MRRTQQITVPAQVYGCELGRNERDFVRGFQTDGYNIAFNNTRWEILGARKDLQAFGSVVSCRIVSMPVTSLLNDFISCQRLSLYCDAAIPLR